MRFKIIKILIFLILLTPLFSYLWWQFSKEKPVNIYILDKTVSTFQRNEHLALNWVLNQYRYTKDDLSSYQANTDYDGFYPLKNKQFYTQDMDSLDESQLDSLSSALDLVYYTDLYGVYENEWYYDKNETEHSKLIYGGMTENEYLLLEKMKNQKKLIISEFNMIASPTSSTIRHKTEQLFDIHWTGWTCRYFSLLDTTKNKELPRWVIRLYKEQNNGNWPFKKSGIVFVHENSRIEILEKKTHLKDELPFIFTSEYGQKTYQLPAKISYPYWIDITYSGHSNQVVSTYLINPNDEGQKLLKDAGIPLEFPAVIEHIDDYKFYYFCGDFTDNPININSSFFRGISGISFAFYNSDQLEQRKQFFWTFYRPMIKEILRKHLLTE